MAKRQMMEMRVSDDGPLGELTGELITLVFGWLPPQYVCNTCAFVCKSWRDAAVDPTLWSGYCNNSGLSLTDELKCGSWKALFVAVYGPNMVASSCFKPLEQVEVDRNKNKQLGPWEAKHRILLDRFVVLDDPSEDYHRYSHWAIEGGSQFHRGGGDGIVRECPPVGCPPCPSVPEDSVIATSCEWGRVQQYIGLHSFSNRFLDECPPIVLTAWFVARPGASGSFRMYLLLRDDLKNVKSIWDSGVLAAKEGEWQQAKFLIKGYSKGVRSFIVKVTGKSNEAIRGFHGTKFTDIRLRFAPVSQLRHYVDYEEGAFVSPPP